MDLQHSNLSRVTAVLIIQSALQKLQWKVQLFPGTFTAWVNEWENTSVEKSGLTETPTLKKLPPSLLVSYHSTSWGMWAVLHLHMCPSLWHRHGLSKNESLFYLFHHHPDFPCLFSIKVRVLLMLFVLPGTSPLLKSTHSWLWNPLCVTDAESHQSFHLGLWQDPSLDWPLLCLPHLPLAANASAEMASHLSWPWGAATESHPHLPIPIPIPPTLPLPHPRHTSQEMTSVGSHFTEKFEASTLISWPTSCKLNLQLPRSLMWRGGIWLSGPPLLPVLRVLIGLLGGVGPLLI